MCEKTVDHEPSLDADLQQACQRNDASAIAAALGAIVKKERQFTRIARETRLNRSGLYRSFAPDGDPHLSTLCKVIAKLGYRLQMDRVAE